jgi:predicted AAA+ superfamily ATPase
MLQLTQWSFTEMHAAFRFTPEQYVWFGGYPGAASLIKDPVRWKNYILHSLIETSVSKDILMLNRVAKPVLLRKLFELGSSYSGQILSYNKILGQFLDAGNTTTLAHYLQLLNGAGLLCGLEKFSPRKVSVRSSSPKFQVRDNSFISVFSSGSFAEIRKNPSEWGRMVESAIGAHLINLSIAGGYEVYYWREKNDELDFVITKGKKIIGIEVKTNARFRISGAKAFQKNFKPDKILLVGDAGIDWQEFLKMIPGELF